MNPSQPESSATTELTTWCRVLIRASSAIVALALISACAAGTPRGEPESARLTSVTGGDARSWCDAALKEDAGQLEGLSLKDSVTTTMRAVQAWRDVQGSAAGFIENLQDRFPTLSSLAPDHRVGVCLFTGTPRPIPHPGPANVRADGLRIFVTPSGSYVVDAIGPQMGMLEEMAQLR